MMRSELLADVDLCEKGLEHGGRLPLQHHSLKVRAHVWVLVPGVSVPEVDDEFSGGGDWHILGPGGGGPCKKCPDRNL